MTVECPPILFKEDDEESFEKTLSSIYNTGYLNVWEGAVRSGKTVYALIAFLNYIKHSDETVFLLSGRTLPTIEKNCILGEYGIQSLVPSAKYGKIGNSNAISFRAKGQTKIIFVSGASDIKSYMSLRGNTYAGWFADEINMHDQRFVEEALNRTVKSSDRRHFWSLNPDNPNAWIYKDYLDRYDALTDDERKALGGYHWWHYTPKDNPALTPEMIRSLEMQFPKDSYLYARYVLGQRVVAEGLVYPRVTAALFRPEQDMVGTDIRYCAIDYGATHATVMVFGGMFKGNKMDWRIVDGYYDENSDKTTYDHYVAFLDKCQQMGVDPKRMIVAIDPAAKVLRQEFIRHGLNVIKAKNDVLPGIEYTRNALYDGRLIMSERIKDKALPQFASYSWDPKASERGEEKPIKQNDDYVDAIRYYAFTFMKPVTGA